MSLTQIPDLVLVSQFKDLLVEETERFVVQLEYLAELDRRKLFFEYDSLWAYLVEECGMEESTAERKIRAARMVKRFPQLRPLLESGQLNLSLLDYAQACSVREKLDENELWELLASISGMSCRQARREIASLYPVTDEATDYRERHHPEAKAERAHLREAKKTGPSRSPSTSKVIETDRRNPTQAVVHALTRSDGYVCSYVDPQTGKRCTSCYALEIDHAQPWALGGPTEVKNLRFLCRSHHRRASFLQFGDFPKRSNT